MKFREFDPATDLERVTEIINVDRFGGDPPCTPELLLDAVAGKPHTDEHLWRDLAVSTAVIDEGEGPVAVVSFANSQNRPVGELLWLHANEQETLLRDCLDYAMRKLATPTIHAFNLSSMISLGSEGLPTRGRPTTVRVLAEAGFEPDALWSVMVKPLTQGPRSFDSAFAVTIENVAQRCRLSIIERDVEVGHAEVEIIQTVGVIWYFFVDEIMRRKGVGSSLLAAAECLLHQKGAIKLLLSIDHGDIHDQWDRSAAVSLCLSLGFTQVDQFKSFIRQEC